jgi:hypothetical protein
MQQADALHELLAAFFTVWPEMPTATPDEAVISST